MWSRHRVLEASHAWQWVPPGAEVLEVAGVVVIDYPEWARMGFYAMPAELAEPASVVSAVCEAARARGRAAIEWWVTPSTTPAGIKAELEAILTERGAVVSDVADILACDLTAGVPDVPVPEGVRVLVVTDAHTLDDAESVAAQVWGGDPSSGQRRDDQLRSLGDDPLDDEGGFRVVAYRGDVPFATGGCQVVDGVARLYGGCVLAQERGRGGYRATLRLRLEVARDHGARLALVHARVDTSKPVLTRLGFESFGEGRLYTLPV